MNECDETFCINAACVVLEAKQLVRIWQMCDLCLLPRPRSCPLIKEHENLQTHPEHSSSRSSASPHSLFELMVSTCKGTLCKWVIWPHKSQHKPTTSSTQTTFQHVGCLRCHIILAVFFLVIFSAVSYRKFPFPAVTYTYEPCVPSNPSPAWHTGWRHVNSSSGLSFMNSYNL